VSVATRVLVPDGKVTTPELVNDAAVAPVRTFVEEVRFLLVSVSAVSVATRSLVPEGSVIVPPFVNDAAEAPVNTLVAEARFLLVNACVAVDNITGSPANCNTSAAKASNKSAELAWLRQVIESDVASLTTPVLEGLLVLDLIYLMTKPALLPKSASVVSGC
jgi:hypothetical protein